MNMETRQGPRQPDAAIVQVVEYMKANGLIATTAESCTAGLIASRLAGVAGAGQILEVAFVVYDPQAKRRCLGVPDAVLARHNLTSEPVALEMARGALRSSGANLAIANTGVADDSDPQVEAGTQCFAWIFRDGDRTRAFTETRVFPGDRNAIREASADHALARIPHYHRSRASIGPSNE